MNKRTKRLLAMMSSKPKLRKISGLPPLTYTAKEEGTLKNYRIYGQTVDGESVGDRTANLFDSRIEQGSFNSITGVPNDFTNRVRAHVNDYIYLTPGKYKISASGVEQFVIYAYDSSDIDTFNANLSNISWVNLPSTITINTSAYYKFGFRKDDDSVITPSDISNIMLNEGSTPLPYEPYGYKVPMTVEGKNLFDAEIVQGSFNNSTGAPTVVPDRIRSNGNAFIFLNSGIYTINANGAHDVVVYCYSSNDVSTFVKSASEVSWQNLPYKFTANAAYYYLFAFRNATNSTITTSDVSNIMLNTGSNPLPYEPYHAPITTPIYLPEQIRKVGDEAEYIEYGTQKMYRIGADDLDVTLPVLPTVTGTNVLSVGAEVNPSEVEVTGRIRPVPTGGGE